MNTQRPDPRAEVRALLALITDEATRAPSRAPRPFVIKWFADLAAAVGLTPAQPKTVADLRRSALALRQVLDAHAAVAATREAERAAAEADPAAV